MLLGRHASERASFRLRPRSGDVRAATARRYLIAAGTGPDYRRAIWSSNLIQRNRDSRSSKDRCPWAEQAGACGPGIRARSEYASSVPQDSWDLLAVNGEWPVQAGRACCKLSSALL